LKQQHGDFISPTRPFPTDLAKVVLECYLPPSSFLSVGRFLCETVRRSGLGREQFIEALDESAQL